MLVNLGLGEPSPELLWAMLGSEVGGPSAEHFVRSSVPGANRIALQLFQKRSAPTPGLILRDSEDQTDGPWS